MVRTPFGEPSGALTFGRIGCQEVVFLARHGYGHTIPPHRVNYRANMWALTKGPGAEGIVSVASVGGIRADLVPGTLVVPHQIIDYTWGRQVTFHEGNGHQVVHIDFTEPYDRALRAALAGGGAAKPARPWSMARSMPPLRDRAWRRRPKSTAWSATVPTSSA